MRVTKESKKMENKLFDADYSKKLFTITIDVRENGSLFAVSVEKDVVLNYHQLIGALETTKHNLIAQQSKKNQEQAEKEGIAPLKSPPSKTTIDQFISAHPAMDVRLKNSLLNWNNNNVDNPEYQIYVEDITMDDFLKHRNTGRKTWNKLQLMLNRK